VQPLYIVFEEVWSISSKANERTLLETSERPLYSGGTRRLAYAYARELASAFQHHGVHDEEDQLYWWGRNVSGRGLHRFVIKPAPPSAPLFVVKNDRPRGRPLRTALPDAPAVEAPGADIV
jgi:hypothetical protein